MGITIGIVGGGAAGMTAAISAARQGAEVTVFEGNERLGKKILSTGNGKCNLGNLDMGPEKYYSENPELLKEYLNRFGTNETIEFFRTLGLMIKEKNGYLYPVSEQASTVLDVLRFEMERQKDRIHVIKELCIDRVEQDKKQKKIKLWGGKQTYVFDRVILSCGGKAAPKTGSDGSGYKLAGMLGHSIIPVVPALVQLRCREDWFKSVAGVRTEAALSFSGRNGRNATECGELQITDYGISGIPVFQISRQINYILRKQKEVEVAIDFLPGFEKAGFVEKMIETRLSVKNCRTVEEYFSGMLNKKLMLLFIRLAGLKPTEQTGNISREKILQVYELCRNLRVHVTGSNSFENAQVCAGGVPLTEVKGTLESRLVPGVFFAGEILDVDGRCGGYNLQWAWCSGYLAGMAAAEK